MPMKAPLAAEVELTSAPGCVIHFSGASKSKHFFEKIGFRLGLDLAILRGRTLKKLNLSGKLA
jgi:hypothetical protein